MIKQLHHILLPITLGLLLLSTQGFLHAQQESTPRDSVVTPPYRLLYLSHDLRLGWSKLYNEYLSPLYYRGYTLGYRLSSEAPFTQAHPDWLLLQSTHATIGLLLNPARTSTTQHLTFVTHWSGIHQWHLPWGLTLGIGPGIMLEGSTYLNGRNQNNPADQQLNGDLTAQSLVAYRIRLGWFVADLRLKMEAALVGLGFAPYYNESYLQAYYYDKIINHIAPHSFGRRHFYHAGCSLDLPIWRITTLRITYDYTSSARSIHTIYRGHSGHELGIGFATYFRPFRGYQEVKEIDHTSAITL